MKKILVFLAMLAVSFILFSMDQGNKSINNNAGSLPEVKEDVLTPSQNTTENKININLVKGKVERVVDGDTAIINIDGKSHRVRFIGVNTPESTTRIEEYGKEASNFTKKYLTGKEVYLEKDVSQTDKYDRLLRYIWLENPDNLSLEEIESKMFNAILLKEGYAQVATFPPDVKYVEKFKIIQRKAREQNLGLWQKK